MTTITVQNLKCGGCANTITKAVQSVEGISNVSVDIEQSTVTFQPENDTLIDKIKSKLAHLGYPEAEADNTLIHKAVSYISCATGKMSTKEI